jgi:hypothetical protein
MLETMMMILEIDKLLYGCKEVLEIIGMLLVTHGTLVILQNKISLDELNSQPTQTLKFPTGSGFTMDIVTSKKSPYFILNMLTENLSPYSKMLNIKIYFNHICT